ncbi:MAG: hypothetical protein K5925_05185 [Bacilli bacterium]|nr:hypothetical protein [Bacilli bacterium]
MKISKKIIISSLSTALGVSLVGAISGTVAWYQYNTAVRTSLIGMNVAETGVLDISATSATTGFKRDLTSSELGIATDLNITPITWETGANQTASSALSGTAYKNPNSALNRAAKDAGGGHAPGAYADVYQAAVATDYIQYTVYLRGRTVDNATGGFTLTAEKVYLTDFVLNNVDSGVIAEGLRVHIACYDDSTSVSPDRNYLISKTAKAALPLFGKLDCDDDGIADRIGGYEWSANRDDVVTYGTDTRTQTTIAPSSLINTPDANGVITDDAGKLIVTTPTTADHASKLVVTVWLEGWENSTNLQKEIQHITAEKPAAESDVEGKYADRYAATAALTAGSKADGKSYYYTKNAAVTVPMWSGLNTDGAKFQLGMTFNVSSDAFKA